MQGASGKQGADCLSGRESEAGRTQVKFLNSPSSVKRRTEERERERERENIASKTLLLPLRTAQAVPV